MIETSSKKNLKNLLIFIKGLDFKTFPLKPKYDGFTKICNGSKPNIAKKEHLIYLYRVKPLSPIELKSNRYLLIETKN